MTDELNEAITGYYVKWDQLVAARKDKAFFQSLRPTAVCLKLAALAELDARVAALRDQADHIHWGWLNERWLVTIHLRNTRLEQGIELVKLYQRRPGSADALGLDHIDFYVPEIDKDVLADEPELEWTHERNGEHSSWISLWFDGTEAKLRTSTTFEVCAAELQELNDGMIGK